MTLEPYTRKDRRACCPFFANMINFINFKLFQTTDHMLPTHDLLSSASHVPPVERSIAASRTMDAFAFVDRTVV
jgi:hypothetical protein